ncbi:MAG: type II secretion system GspH family protein [Gammaproteobacteria bacterium]|nr:type II secretion system GspH family protein [Gammaproteobacteria bacterium]MBU1732591.1 type II secretion system GspH family protein [Gammaproteobacteria bacterium]MBU1893454.1 type II secretion system GspH family protein [Gammaproteobacteria bacterium]
MLKRVWNGILNQAHEKIFGVPDASRSRSRQKGFSLIELAIVLVVVALLIGGLLVPLTMQVEQQRIRDTQKTLEEIKEALLGFAIANGRLPRPAVSAANGAENAADCGTDAACTGFIPWATLGVPKLDGWGKMIRYSVTPDFARSVPFTLNSTVATKTIQTRDGAGALNYLAGQAACAVANQCMPAVVFSHGKNNWGTSDAGGAIADGSLTNADEDANNAASTNFISRTITDNTAVTGGEFDDLVTWLSPNILFNRMVAAGRLP